MMKHKHIRWTLDGRRIVIRDKQDWFEIHSHYQRQIEACDRVIRALQQRRLRLHIESDRFISKKIYQRLGEIKSKAAAVK